MVGFVAYLNQRRPRYCSSKIVNVDGLKRDLSDCYLRNAISFESHFVCFSNAEKKHKTQPDGALNRTVS